jgi:hypothetical protein
VHIVDADDARAPWWEAAALADAANRPVLYTAMGLERAKARLADMNFRASVIDSA